MEAPILYKIVSDPYFKRMSIEKYLSGKFSEVIYDSAVLDFRHLQPIDQLGWEKERIEEDEKRAWFWIRNQDDRIILQEECLFEQGRCRECRIYSPFGSFLSYHRLFYIEMGDEFNGTLLIDCNDRPVFLREFESYNPIEGFHKPVREKWEMKDYVLPSPIIT